MSDSDDSDVEFVGEFDSKGRNAKTDGSASNNGSDKSENEESEVEFLKEVVLKKGPKKKDSNGATTSKLGNKSKTAGKQRETITLDTSVDLSVQALTSKKKKKFPKSKSPKASKAPAIISPQSANVPDQIDELRNSIFSVLEFEEDQRVFIPMTDQSLEKIYAAQEHLSKWVARCKQNAQLNVIRFHFESIDAILNVLTNEYQSTQDTRRNNASTLYLLYSQCVINFCCSIESYTHFQNQKHTSIKNFANKLMCPEWVVDCRHSVAHANRAKPELPTLRRSLVVALRWMETYFFPNLSIITQAGRDHLVYTICFPRAKIKSTINGPLASPQAGASTSQNNTRKQAQSTNLKRQRSVDKNQATNKRARTNNKQQQQLNNANAAQPPKNQMAILQPTPFHPLIQPQSIYPYRVEPVIKKCDVRNYE